MEEGNHVKGTGVHGFRWEDRGRGMEKNYKMDRNWMEINYSNN